MPMSTDLVSLQVDPNAAPLPPNAGRMTKGCHLQVMINLAPRIGSLPEWLINACFRNLAFQIFGQVREAEKLCDGDLCYKDRQQDPHNSFYSFIKRRIRDSVPGQTCPDEADLPVHIEEESLAVLQSARNLLQRVQVHDMMAKAREVLPEDYIFKHPKAADPRLLEVDNTLEDGSITGANHGGISTTAEGAEDLSLFDRRYWGFTDPEPIDDQKYRETIMYASDPMNNGLVVAKKVKVPQQLGAGVATQEAGIGRIEEKTDVKTETKENAPKTSTSVSPRKLGPDVDDFSDEEGDGTPIRTRAAGGGNNTRGVHSTSGANNMLSSQVLKSGPPGSNMIDSEKEARRAALQASVFGHAATGDLVFEARPSISGTTVAREDLDAMSEVNYSGLNSSGPQHHPSQMREHDNYTQQGPPSSDPSSLALPRLTSGRLLDHHWARTYLKAERRVTVLNVQEGMKVRPGLHWRYQDEHMSQAFGTVVKFDLRKRFVQVKWEDVGWFSTETKVHSHYRMGPTFFDLAVWKEEDPEMKGKAPGS
ncbi:unnamed protein product [Amoebophrya sp. A25]|nr:unnamed protein product [Amoebophrya sp. A25]|eukprot:GSA25T00006784001.1